MPGLIPLMLNTATAGTRASVIGPPEAGDSPQASPKASSPPAGTPGSPTTLQRLSRRYSQAPGALPLLPYTPAEWARAVAEVKRLHLHRRYRPCSARCSAILDNIKDTSAVEPAYLIYLHFYAALSMEMSARALGAGPHRAGLLRQSETHYTRAASLVSTENASVHRLSRASSSTASTHSPVGSVSSRASTASTRLSSPTPSLFEERLPSAMRASGASAPKKRVTFSDVRPDSRPDSPTLGLDDWVEPKAAPPARPEEEAEDLGLFFDASTDRYASVLGELLTQVNVHLSAVRAELREDVPSGRSTPESPVSSHGSSASVASVGSVSSDGDAREDLRERIDRLRLNGWRRRRFDPGRYEALRESVLAELD